VASASSSSVYGDQDVYPLHEGMYPNPRSPYAASKLAAEGFCRAMWLASGVRSVSLRYFNVFGPGQDPANEYAAVVSRFVVACLSGTSPVIHGDGERARDFTFIDDVVEANLLVLRAPEAAFGGALNIGGGRIPVSINLLLELIAGLWELSRTRSASRRGRATSASPTRTSRTQSGSSATGRGSGSRKDFAGPSTRSGSSVRRSPATSLTACVM